MILPQVKYDYENHALWVDISVIEKVATIVKNPTVGLMVRVLKVNAYAQNILLEVNTVLFANTEIDSRSS